MADLDSTGVTVVRSWTEGGLAQKDRVCKLVQVVLSSMGTAANTVPATAFGLTVIEETTPAVKSDDDVVVPTSPSYDGSVIFFIEDAGQDPADFTGTFQFIVKGY